jgi:hypothetical protein
MGYILRKQRWTLEFKLALLFGFAIAYPNKRCARCVNVATVARNVSRPRPQRPATPLYNRPGRGIENKTIRCRYNFPEIKSSEGSVS